MSFCKRTHALLLSAIVPYSQTGLSDQIRILCSYESSFKVIYSSFSTLTPNDFYRYLATEFGAQPSYRKPDNFRIIQEEISRLTLEKRKTPVIIIDEANHINSATLNDLKILFNFEMDSRDRAAILPALNSTPRLGIHEPPASAVF
ncbi:ATP-binding protein [Acetobacterium wieringae]|uniref:ORC1/DEAH AAA+ ATPase domain-containing protein n=1 Tax=Acetobacterium wieringae TaxID=52694 RepID=A0A1F2PNT5_9FIRM|nr:ATP-binding protein [Acetobacterium wieringae]OFV72401.1 hypothetical protein ACWI_03120 [Acetobacterium wieringae]